MNYDAWKTTPPEPDSLMEVAYEEALDMLPSDRREYLEDRNVDTSGMTDIEIVEAVSEYLYEGMTEQ